MIKVFHNIYTDPNTERNREIEECTARLTYSEHHETITYMGRRTFSQIFSLINETCNEGDIAIISNSDIFFDETIKLAENIGDNECYALSRWDVQANGMAIPFHRHDSQDAWIFRTPIKEIEGAEFPLGRPGSDNKIALLLDQAGYKVTNPCKSIHAFHLHLSGVRNYMDKGKVIDRIPPPYKLITPTEL